MIKKDSRLTGFISGLLAPFVGLYIYYLISFHYMSLRSFINRITEIGLLPGVISLALIANLVLFFFFIRAKADRSAYGVIGATFIYGMIIVYLKVVR